MAAVVQREAERRCIEDARAEQRAYGVLPPCRSIDPLWPPLSLAEYEMMERDTAKYLLYHAAIDAAAASIASKISAAGAPAVLRMVVVGAGGGRLVESCVAACHAHGAPGSSVLALDANPLAVTMNRARFEKNRLSSDSVGTQQPDVSVVVADAFTLMPSTGGQQQGEAAPVEAAPFVGRCHIAVAELLGSFGCNEFLPELMSTMASTFLIPSDPGDSNKARKSVLIPRDWTTWVTPIHCPSVRRYLSLLRKPLVRPVAVAWFE